MNNCCSPARFTPWLVLTYLLSLAGTLAAAEKPNIIVIMADDLAANPEVLQRLTVQLDKLISDGRSRTATQP